MTRDETLTAEEVEGKNRYEKQFAELKQKAENFIIDRYKIAECYREDNKETREYMRIDVHSQYEEEYQMYLAGATENGIKCHDLRKDPNDLPEKIKLVLIRLLGCYVLGWYDGIDFYNDCNKGEKIPKELLIAWCEIPQFKE